MISQGEKVNSILSARNWTSRAPKVMQEIEEITFGPLLWLQYTTIEIFQSPIFHPSCQKTQGKRWHQLLWTFHHSQLKNSKHSFWQSCPLFGFLSPLLALWSEWPRLFFKLSPFPIWLLSDHWGQRISCSFFIFLRCGESEEHIGAEFYEKDLSRLLRCWIGWRQPLINSTTIAKKNSGKKRQTDSLDTPNDSKKGLLSIMSLVENSITTGSAS